MQVLLKHRSIVVRGRLSSSGPALHRHLTMLPSAEPGRWEHRATQGRPGDHSLRSQHFTSSSEGGAAPSSGSSRPWGQTCVGRAVSATFILTGGAGHTKAERSEEAGGRHSSGSASIQSSVSPGTQLSRWNLGTAEAPELSSYWLSCGPIRGERPWGGRRDP